MCRAMNKWLQDINCRIRVYAIVILHDKSRVASLLKYKENNATMVSRVKNQSVLFF